jgi:hypothetical protein
LESGPLRTPLVRRVWHAQGREIISRIGTCM